MEMQVQIGCIKYLTAGQAVEEAFCLDGLTALPKTATLEHSIHLDTKNAGKDWNSIRAHAKNLIGVVS